MQVHIKAGSDAIGAQVEQLLRFYVPGLSDSVETLTIDVSRGRDPLGSGFYRCRIQALLLQGDPLDIEDRQGDLSMAIMRALDRCVRTVRRRRQVRGLARSA